MIHYITIWDSKKNYGKAINDAIGRLNPSDEDWIVHRDGDSCFLTSDWGKQIEDIVSNADGYDLIGCITNRLRDNNQTLGHTMFKEMNMSSHYFQAETMKSNYGIEIFPYDHDIAGFFMLFRVSAWRNNKFKENTPIFDRLFTQGIKKGRVGIVPGLYVLHMYRLWSDNPKNDNKHLF